jgi:Leucine-rich repeat (LRR) protein
LNLNFNKIQELSFLYDLSELEVIELMTNHIEHISPGLFGNMKKLRTVLLDNNFIATIDPDLFSGNPILASIELDYNKMSDFSLNSSSLTILGIEKKGGSQNIEK